MSHVSTTAFALLVWTSLASVAAVFLYLLYTVVRAGGIRLIERHQP
ncbi:MAG: hypothetical protein ABEJ68_11155 [Halobacteriaceae archaeon]